MCDQTDRTKEDDRAVLVDHVQLISQQDSSSWDGNLHFLPGQTPSRGITSSPVPGRQEAQSQNLSPLAPFPVQWPQATEVSNSSQPQPQPALEDLVQQTTAAPQRPAPTQPFHVQWPAAAAAAANGRNSPQPGSPQHTVPTLIQHGGSHWAANGAQPLAAVHWLPVERTPGGGPLRQWSMNTSATRNVEMREIASSVSPLMPPVVEQPPPVQWSQLGLTSHETRPSNTYLFLTIVASFLSIFCCPLTGVTAFIISIHASFKVEERLYTEARQKLVQAIILMVISAFLAAPAIILIIIEYT